MRSAKANADIISAHFDGHLRVVRRCLGDLLREIETVADVLIEALSAERKVIAFGNGGSAAQASHLAGELLGRFAKTRRPYPAIALGSDPGVVTCIGNDFGFDLLFERQVEAFANKGDVVIGFTTSGRSENVRRGLAMARKRGAVTVVLSGRAGLIGGDSDYTIAVPDPSTAYVQEVHLMCLHVWCLLIDEALSETERFDSQVA